MPHPLNGSVPTAAIPLPTMLPPAPLAAQQSVQDYVNGSTHRFRRECRIIPLSISFVRFL
jgi:hypothetical protein